MMCSSTGPAEHISEGYWANLILVLFRSLLESCIWPDSCNDTHAGWTALDAPPVPSRPSSAWDDPKVQQGLYKIAQLDRCLMEKAAAATIVSRETFPEDWEEAGRKRSQRAQTQLAAVIARSVRLLCCV